VDVTSAVPIETQAAADYLSEVGWETFQEDGRWVILTPGTRYRMERDNDDLVSLARGVRKVLEQRCLN